MDAVILSAGKSTRMKTPQSKIFYDLCGKSVVEHVIGTLKESGFDKIVAVINSQHQENFTNLNIETVVQTIPNGTAKACEISLPRLSNDFVVISADTPLIKSETLQRAKEYFTSKKLDCLLLSAKLENPYGYGRVVTKEKGFMIIEQKDANEEILKINRVSSGIFFLKLSFAKEALKKIDNNNSQNEYYLPDVIRFADRCEFIDIDLQEILGINTQNDYSNIRQLMQQRIIEKLMQQGVVFIDPKTAYIDVDVEIGCGSVIYPNVHLRGKTKIGKNCHIDTGNVIDSCSIYDSVTIKPYCVLSESVVEKKCSIGPFSHLRPQTYLKQNVHVGNFVELKKSVLDENTKASHLSYVGDALVGKNVNVGAGTITCNYDGFRKNQTIIGDNVFIGSDTQLVAPVKIGNDCLIAAGTTVTEDTPPFSLVLSRVPQQVKEKWVISYRERFKKEK